MHTAVIAFDICLPRYSSQPKMKLLLVACLLPAVALGQLVGGISDTTVDPTDEPVVFAVKASNYYLSTKGLLTDGQSLELTKVLHARTQVVAGQNLFLDLLLGGSYVCNLTVWYRPWLQHEERLIVTNGPVCNHAAMKRQLGGVNSPTSFDHAPHEVADALDFAVCALNDRSNAMFVSVLGDKSGITYTKQVTAGMTFVFYNVPLAETECRKAGQCADMQNLNACQVKDEGMTSTCTLTVQWQAWMNPAYTLSNMSCK